MHRRRIRPMRDADRLPRGVASTKAISQIEE
jgi:hypothetical protein